MRQPESRLMAGIERLGERGLAVDGVHVAVRGHESVQRRWTPDVRRDMFSASKTFTSVAIGIAQAEGLLDVDDPVLRHLGQLTSAPAVGMEDVAVRQLLTMTSGITYRWDDPDADHPGDPAIEILETSLGVRPGEAFNYRGANSYLLSRIVHACSGEDLRDYLVPRLFDPLGIANAQWSRCPRGYSLGAVGLQLRTEELSRFGVMLRDGGRHSARQIVPAGYVGDMTADAVSTCGHIATGATGPHPDNATYCRHVWLCSRDDAWRMDGMYGQFSIVLPSQLACVTVTAHFERATTDILDAVWADVLPLLS